MLNFPHPSWPSASAEVKDLLRSHMLVARAKDRASSDFLSSHAWFA
jgi:hypothetical protein